MSLAHTGVIGMKWGRRKDRSKGPPSSDHTAYRELHGKSAHELSDAQIRKVISRMQLEKQYKDVNKQGLAKGAAFVDQALATTGKILAGAATVTAAAALVKSVYDKVKTFKG